MKSKGMCLDHYIQSSEAELWDVWTDIDCNDGLLLMDRQTPASLHRTSVWRILDGEQACVHETRDQINVFMYPTLWTLRISWFELLEVMRKSSE
ncbi:hypothetical protein F2P79_009619 [Pimephales promelas]|nr:hypothetical protein F2P79_009619 [Pimephales promelas]